jgi:hypothetical protein
VGTITVGKLNNFDRYCAAVKEVLEKTRLFTVRQPVFVHPKIVDTICPSAFAVPGPPGGSPQLEVCNLMPHGGHHMCAETQTADMQAWYSIEAYVADQLKKSFIFCAHTPDEQSYARRLGWRSGDIFYSQEPRDYLSLYCNARCFIGNRLHGAAVVASRGRPVLAIAADSRLGMVKRLGGKTITPKALKYAMLAKYNRVDFLIGRVPTSYSVANEWDFECKRLKAILRG